MAEKGRIVVNCCGPYHIYGEIVVRACIENNTHQLDISGEQQVKSLININPLNAHYLNFKTLPFYCYYADARFLTLLYAFQPFLHLLVPLFRYTFLSTGNEWC